MVHSVGCSGRLSMIWFNFETRVSAQHIDMLAIYTPSHVVSLIFSLSLNLKPLVTIYSMHIQMDLQFQLHLDFWNIKALSYVLTNLQFCPWLVQNSISQLLSKCQTHACRMQHLIVIIVTHTS